MAPEDHIGVSGFYLCAKEGVYQIKKPHHHLTQEEAHECTTKWAIELALQRDKLIKACEAAMKFIQIKCPKNYTSTTTWQTLASALVRKVDLVPPDPSPIVKPEDL